MLLIKPERRRSSGFEVGLSPIEWNKRHLPLLYEDLSFNNRSTEYERVQDLRTDLQAIIKSFVYDTKGIVPRLEQTFNWITKKITSTCRDDKRIERRFHFERVHSCNPYLLGVNNHNRFKRYTKLLIIRGFFEGEHGIVVGHFQDYNILGDRPNTLKVLISSEEIVNISQADVKLLDLHNFLPFAIPTKHANIPTKRSISKKRKSAWLDFQGWGISWSKSCHHHPNNNKTS